ncbi:tetratricopeptide repeat (TPR)-like superfamily protein [Actinidia rufa]|uniref:Tetratricopeptide repeat (TPR)-like superfamily protein n=1 Tax=Actinidia rufa TaxID=165716 RepID=A0A7J0DEV3_9ERIC|nr:tetratricopeptide repeat (TPR)-like superfamily protein [Actinidia rufa]
MLGSSSLTVVRKFQPILYALSHLLTNHHAFPFNHILSSCTSHSDLEQIHALILTNGSHRNLLLSTKLITLACSLAPTMDYARKMFDEMPHRDVFLWNTLIRGYADLGPCQEAIVLYRDMQFSGHNVLAERGDFEFRTSFWRDDSEEHSFLDGNDCRACAGLEFLNLGKLIHGYALKLGVDSDISLTNTLIALYGKSGNVDTARSLFDRMAVRSLVSWNSMIAAYEQNKAGGTAIKLFRRMQIQKFEFDYITMVSVISACANLGALNTGKWVHDLVRGKGLETNFSVTNALIDNVCKMWKHRFGQRDVLTSCLIRAWHAGLVDEGRKYFKSMTEDYSITPGLEHCACLVDLLGRAGQLMEAYEFIENMPSSISQPS